MIKTENLEKYFNKGRRNEIHVINNNNIELPDTGCGATIKINTINITATVIIQPAKSLKNSVTSLKSI